MDNESIFKEELEKIKAELKKELTKELDKKIKRAIRKFNKDRLLLELYGLNNISFMLYCMHIIVYPGNENFAKWRYKAYSLTEWENRRFLEPDQKLTVREILKSFFAECDTLDDFEWQIDSEISIMKCGNPKIINTERKFRDYRLFCKELAEILSKKPVEYSVFISLVDKYLVNP